MRLGQRLISIESANHPYPLSTVYSDTVSVEQALNDIALLSCAKTALESRGSLSDGELNLVQGLLSNVYERHTLCPISVESYGALEASLEGALTELWRKVKNSVITGAQYFANGVEFLFKYYVQALSALNAAIQIGA